MGAWGLINPHQPSGCLQKTAMKNIYKNLTLSSHRQVFCLGDVVLLVCFGNVQMNAPSLWRFKKKHTQTTQFLILSLGEATFFREEASFFQRELSPAEYPPPIFRLVSSVQYYYSPVCTMYHLRALYLPMSYSILCAWMYSFHTYINVSKYNLIHTSLFCMFQL